MYLDCTNSVNLAKKAKYNTAHPKRKDSQRNFTMALMVDKILALFPNTSLPKIHGELSSETINDVVQHMYANAATVSCHLGGGQHGHIGLIMKPALYHTLSEAAYVRPNDPRPPPVYNLNI